MPNFKDVTEDLNKWKPINIPFSWIRIQYPNMKMLVLPKLICRLTQFSSKSKDSFVQLKNHSKLYPKKQNSQES